MKEIPTFEGFYKTWHGQMAPQWRRLHRQGVDDVFRAHLLPRLGNVPLDKIDRDAVFELRAALAQAPGRGGRPLSASRINKVMRLFSQMIGEAAMRYPIESPCKGIKPLRIVQPEIQPFSLEEVKLIIDSIRPDHRDYMLTRFLTGMRTGEVDGLHWEHVDFRLNVIKVRGIYSAGMRESGGKTASASRDIPMLPQLRQALLARHEARDRSIPWVFHTRNGKPIDAHNFTNRIWYPLLDHLGLAKRRPYQTRHTAATLLLASGESPEWIARILGHVNTDMLFKVYSSYVPNATHQDGSEIERIIGNVLDQRT